MSGPLTEAMTECTTKQWCAILDSADIPNGAVNTLEDLLADDYLREHPTEGPITMLAIPMELDCTPISIRAPAPKLGEHTDDVLQEAGLSEDQIAAASRC